MDFISLDRMFGVHQSGRRGFWENFTIGGMVKFRRDQNQIKAQKLKAVFFLKQTKSKKRIFERANLEDGF